MMANHKRNQTTSQYSNSKQRNKNLPVVKNGETSTMFHETVLRVGGGGIIKNMSHAEGMSFGPDGHHLVVARQDQNIAIYTLDTLCNSLNLQVEK